MKRETIAFLGLLLVLGCTSNQPHAARLVPAEEFAKSVHSGEGKDYSIFRAQDALEKSSQSAAAIPASADVQAATNPGLVRAALVNPDTAPDPRYAAQGLRLKERYQTPVTKLTSDGDVAGSSTPPEVSRQLPYPPQLPPGSYAPYASTQMTGNPSLWPDEAQGATYFTDFRAFQAMDVITILINENSSGNKKTKTDAEGKFDITAGIEKLFGIETKKWVSNNTALDPSELIKATTETNFEGEGETKREGKMKAQLSAVILEVLPNGLLRVEGSKIVSVDSEEEVMVISGLVRLRDINSQNQVESNRVANMRIDFYGRGVLAEQQAPGWGARLVNWVWPF